MITTRSLSAVNNEVGRNVVWMAACCFSLLCGCGTSGPGEVPKFVQVTGAVQYCGRPLPEALLTFHPDGGGEAAFAIADARGRFSAATNDLNGILPGEYRVTVTHPKMLLPAKYIDEKSSPLVVIAFEDEAEHNFPINLTD